MKPPKEQLISNDQYRHIRQILDAHPNQDPRFQGEAFAALVREYVRINRNEYKVGYKRPPLATQFQVGHPGGPGRPKGSAATRLLLERLGERANDVCEALADKIITKALKGDLKAARLLIELVDGRLPVQNPR